MYCLDRQSDPPDEFNGAKSGLEQKSGVTLTYKRVDVTDVETLNATVSDIADQHKRLDGLVAAAGMQHKLTPALDYTPDMVAEVSIHP